MAGSSQRRTGQTGSRIILYTCAALLALLLITEATTRESGGAHRASAVCGMLLIIIGLGASRQLRLAERSRYREAQSYVDLAGAILISLDLECRVSMANPRACEAFGLSQDELCGQLFQDLIANGHEREHSAERFRAIMAGDADALAGKVRRSIARSDASTRDVEWQLVAARDERGTLTGLLVSGEDITEALRREAELARDLEDVRRLRQLTQIIATAADARPALLSCAVALVDADVVSLAQRASDPVGALMITHSSHQDQVGLPVREDLSADVSTVRLEVGLGDDPRAALLIFEGSDPEVGPRDQQILEFLAGETALALQAIHDRGELQRAALTDPLTGIANRRAFDRALADRIADAEVTRGDLNLIILDLDGFKALNDSSGHEAGDDLLRACAASWVAALRDGDLLARLGGDEFAVSLPSSTAATAASIRSRLELATPSVVGVSSGSACWSGQSPGAFLAEADKSMYLAKSDRRLRLFADPGRLAAVNRSRAQLATRDGELDALAGQLRGTLGVPGVFITLVEDELVSCIAASGADTEPPWSVVGNSYCQHVVAGSAPLMISDAGRDRLINNSAADRGGVVAYAGVPLASGDGQILGAVCAADSEPRDWTATDLSRLHEAALRVRALLGEA